ncbi:ThiF family adenylyltransferase [Sulfurimonas sp. HSL-3221]|uniref:ThiF family adenylyltransferase n=1 Tax=Sulfurimonadaceae TaxID=2771471 RepID=UPI001E324A9A|nr:ThiF family adenylyltransferase [Sulfurimonas sp. HSL-3221]UFS62747.1 ThiF family adenylyltransferase [Sulfurimonas sp. HSL-3221]
MSTQLINRSPDLKRLRDEGFSVHIKGGLLVIDDVPYVTAERKVSIGTLVSTLALQGEKAAYDNMHVAHFAGSQPCFADGRPINEIMHQTIETNHGNGIITKMSFSSKPSGGYRDYHHKMITYINILQAQAQVIDSSMDAKRFRPLEDDVTSVFNYVDTNASRASITELTEMFAEQKIGIVGLGGTGSYILDFIAKTPVKEIHLFDGDAFLTHNAFRAPGAPSIEQLNEGMSKVDYLSDIYSKMHKGIRAHSLFMTEQHMELLKEMDFVFVSIDSGEIKRLIFDYLDGNDIPYIDVGMGLTIEEKVLRGSVRTTAFMAEEHKGLRRMIDFSEGVDNAYSTNIQIAELNGLNAAIAVLRWKQHLGFYQSLVDEGQVMFSINTLGLVKT